MRFSLRFWRGAPPASKMPHAPAAPKAVSRAGRDRRDGRDNGMEYATLCDGRVVAIPRAHPAGAMALLAEQEAAERRLRACLREAVRERDNTRPRGPWRAA